MPALRDPERQRVFSTTDVLSSKGPCHSFCALYVPDFLPLFSFLSAFAAHHLFVESTRIACCFCNQVNKWGTATDFMCIRPTAVIVVLIDWPAKAKNDKKGCACVGGWLCFVGATLWRSWWVLPQRRGEMGGTCVFWQPWKRLGNGTQWKFLGRRWSLARWVKAAGFLCLPILTCLVSFFFFRHGLPSCWWKMVFWWSDFQIHPH